MLESDIAFHLQFLTLPLIATGLVLLFVEFASPITACRLVERGSRQLERMDTTAAKLTALINLRSFSSSCQLQMLVITVFSFLALSYVTSGNLSPVEVAQNLIAAVVFFCWIAALQPLRFPAASQTHKSALDQCAGLSPDRDRRSDGTRATRHCRTAGTRSMDHRNATGL